MKTVWATYLNNIPEIPYPIGFLKSQLPDLIVFCGTEKDKQYLLSQGIPSICIDYPIKCKEDISAAQNICVDKIFNQLDCSFLVFTQADIFITEEGHRLIKEWCVEENLGKVADLKVRGVRLFFLTKSHHYGVTLWGRGAEKKHRYIGDGSYVNDFKTLESSEDTCVDIGYLSIENSRAHIKKQCETWNLPHVVVSDDNHEFTKTMIERNAGENLVGFIKKGTPHYDLICKMGLEKEYEKVKEITESLTNKIAV